MSTLTKVLSRVSQNAFINVFKILFLSLLHPWVAYNYRTVSFQVMPYYQYVPHAGPTAYTPAGALGRRPPSERDDDSYHCPLTHLLCRHRPVISQALLTRRNRPLNGSR